MARSLFRQDTQIHTSGSYDDTLTLANAESSASSLQDDLNYIRTAFKAAKGTTNWHDSTTDTLSSLSSRTKLEDRKVNYLVQLTADITVPASQNWVELGTGEFPVEDMAIATGLEGAITAQLAGAIGSHALTAVSTKANVCHIRLASTNGPIYDSGLEIYGLLQVGSAATDGNPFAATGDDQAQISFVTFNPSTDAIQAASVGSIENQVIEYAYRVRSNLRDMPENAFDNTFNSVAASAPTSLTMDNAYNGGSLVTVDDTNVDFRVTDTKFLQVADSAGVAIFKVAPDSGGDTVTITTDTLDINNVNTVDVSNGVAVDTSGTTINLGVTAGQIDATALTVSATAGALAHSATGNISLTSSGGEISFNDTRTAAINFSDASNTTLFGGATSILGAINAAGAAGGVDLTVGRVVVNAGGISANTTVTSSNTTQLTDAPNALVAYASVAEFTDSLLIFVNGALQASGESAATNNDVYAAGTAGNGEMAFEYDLQEGDIITVIKLVA